MKGNFDRALARVLVYEGGYSDNPADPGGATNKGVTQRTYNGWLNRQGLSVRSVKQITAEEVATIYKDDYWDRVYADEMPAGVDFCLFDAAVNSGVGAAATWAQAVLALKSDGDFGPKTRAAIEAYDPENFIHDFCSRRLGSLQRLRTWSKFGKGWHARISNVQKIADAWSESADPLVGGGPDPVQVDTIGGHQKADINDIQPTLVSQVTTHVTTAGGAIGTAATSLGQQLSTIGTDVISWMKYVMAGITITGATAGVLVMIAQKSGDQATNGLRTATVSPTADEGLTRVSVVDPPAPAPVVPAKA